MWKIAIGAVFLTSLLACVAPSFTQPVDKDFAVSDVIDDGITIKGRYDPAGFTSANGRRMASFSCKEAALATYGETEVDGQIVFQATCRDGTVHGAGSGVNFIRVGPRMATYSSVFTLNGQITFADGDFPL
ncbi:MAG: hypothetical protein ABJL99_08035 [Aliishimia sp.]